MTAPFFTTCLLAVRKKIIESISSNQEIMFGFVPSRLFFFLFMTISNCIQTYKRNFGNQIAIWILLIHHRINIIFDLLIKIKLLRVCPSTMLS